MKFSVYSDSGEAVYVDDISVSFPPGHQLNLGSLDSWADGLPAIPTIATNLSAADVWAVVDGSFGANTMGEKINKIKKLVDDAIVLGLI